MTRSALSPAVTVDDTTARRLLYNLVMTPSPSGQEGGAARLLVDWMTAQNYTEAFVDEAGNAVGVMGRGSREIVLLGHIDTFGGQPPVYIENGRLYGRGSVDAKGSLCTFAVAAARARLNPDLRVVVIGAVEEEAASSRGARHAATQYQPELCLIGEPSNWDRITLGYKGRLVLRWEWRGALAHSANCIPTPAEQAVRYWQRVLDYTNQVNGDETRLFHTLDATLQDLNTAQDGAYGRAVMTIGFRVPPELSPATIADDLAPIDGATVRISGLEWAHRGPKDSALSRALRRAIRQEGGNPRFVHKTGTSDMNVVARHWDCPLAAYGPGDSALDHTPDEHLDLDDYLRAVRVLQRALEQL